MHNVYANRRGSVLAVSMGILGCVAIVAMATSTRSASTTRHLDAARARRLLSVCAKSVASEASYMLEDRVGKDVGQGSFRERAEKLTNGGAPRTVDVPLTREQFAPMRVTVGPVTAVFSEVKRLWEHHRGPKPAAEDPSTEFQPEKPEKPEGNGPGEDDGPPDEQAGGPGGNGGNGGGPGAGPEGGKGPGDDFEDPDANGGNGGKQGGFQDRDEGDDGGAKEGGKGGKKGKWKKRGAWAVVQMKFDISVETQGRPFKKRIAIRRYVMLRKWGWHPLRIDQLDVARSQEAIP